MWAMIQSPLFHIVCMVTFNVPGFPYEENFAHFCERAKQQVLLTTAHSSSGMRFIVLCHLPLSNQISRLWPFSYHHSPSEIPIYTAVYIMVERLKEGQQDALHIVSDFKRHYVSPTHSPNRSEGPSSMIQIQQQNQHTLWFSGMIHLLNWPPITTRSQSELSLSTSLCPSTIAPSCPPKTLLNPSWDLGFIEQAYQPTREMRSWHKEGSPLVRCNSCWQVDRWVQLVTWS